MLTQIKTFIAANKIAFYAGIAVVIGLVLVLAYCQGRSDGEADQIIDQQKREIETQQEIGKANEGAAGQRVEDAARSEREKKELSDALKAVNDPDRQRALRGCVILRQQGRDTSGIPACSGSPDRP